MTKNLFSILKYRKLQRLALNEEEQLICELDSQMQFVVAFDIPEYEKIPHTYRYSLRRCHHALARFFYIIAKMRALKLHGIIRFYLEWPGRPDLTRHIYSFER